MIVEYFEGALKFLQVKEWGPKFLGEPIWQKVWIIWSPLHYFNFKSFMYPNSSRCMKFECILHDRGVLFSEAWNVYKLKTMDLISGGNQFCRKSELLGSAFCISILKVCWTQFVRYSGDFNPFCMIHQYSPQSLEISKN